MSSSDSAHCTHPSASSGSARDGLDDAKGSIVHSRLGRASVDVRGGVSLERKMALRRCGLPPSELLWRRGVGRAPLARRMRRCSEREAAAAAAATASMPQVRFSIGTAWPASCATAPEAAEDGAGATEPVT